MAWTQTQSRIAAGLCLSLVLMSSPAGATDTVLVGSVDANTANLWPLYIAQKNGYFNAVDINPEMVFSQSNASVIQQLAANSYHIAPSAGIVDPIRAIEKGAPVSILRILIQSPPYALLARSSIKTIKDLKGKTIIIGGAKDVTRIFTERMLAPNGLKSGDYDYIFAGATSARFSALQSGAVDAAILTASPSTTSRTCRSPPWRPTAIGRPRIPRSWSAFLQRSSRGSRGLTTRKTGTQPSR